MKNYYPKYEHLYGKYVQITDRWESVHIWSEQKAEKNMGRWVPTEISEEEYNKEMQHLWNQN